MTVAFLLGHALNYALMLGANRILGAGGFGFFYTAVLSITVAMAPMMAITVVMARRFADLNATRGRDVVALITRRCLWWCILWATPAAILLGFVLATIGPWLGVEAWPVMLLIPATVLALVAAEILRSSFQSRLQFGLASVLWVLSQAAQCAFATAGLLWLGTVWAGIAGILAGATLVSVIFSIPFFCGKNEIRTETADDIFLHFRKNVPMILSYSLFILLNNIDILVGYWLLPRSSLDIYAASALLPKAIITATLPVAQVVLPVLIEQRSVGHSSRLSILKAIVLTTGMGVMATFALWLIVPIIQDSPLAIRGLDSDIMIILLVGAIALSATRVLVVIELALQRFAVGLAQAVAILIYMVTCILAVGKIEQLAEFYTIVSWGFLLMTAVVTLVMMWPKGGDITRSGGH